MKNLYKNPVFYFALAPVVTAFWPLLLWSVYLPASHRNLNQDMKNYEKAKKLIASILRLDPARLQLAGSQDGKSEFDYTHAVNKVAELCAIPSANYRLSSGIIISSAGKKTQTARVMLTSVDITKFARFLSAIQLRWANLQCTKIKLSKKKQLPDLWDVDLEFKYFY